MKSFLLLLLLSLTTGCESEVKACREGWVEFTCKYTETNKIYKRIVVVKSPKTTIKSTKKDVWENKDKLSVYHDTNKKILRVTIKQLESNDSGNYTCTFDQDPQSKTESLNLDVVAETNGCQTALNQTAYRTAPTTISCDYSGRKSNVRFICKDKGSICEDILSTTSSPKSSGTFTLPETTSGFNMSISDVSPHDAGVYWCGEETEGRYRAALRKIQLEVEKITTFERSPTIGQNFTYWCQYKNTTLLKKFICKGEDPSTCQRLVSTAQLNKTSGRFSIREDNKRTNISITVREVTVEDTGTYWCGAESSDKRHSNTFFNRLVMTVAPVPTTQSTDASADNRGVSHVFIAMIVCVAVLLLFVLILILIFTRFVHSVNTRNGAAAQNIKEDNIYEEILECVQKPDSRNAVNTIYATANQSTNPSAPLHYSTVSFQNRSDRAAGGALILKRGSNACEYSTVKSIQSPTSSTVEQSPRSSEDQE